MYFLTNETDRWVFLIYIEHDSQRHISYYRGQSYLIDGNNYINNNDNK